MEKNQYLTEKQVAGITNFAIQTLRNHRQDSRGIPYLKVGRSVRYRPADVKSYMEKVLIDPEGE
jgi:hypothetical protein